jgi:DNA-binding NtrC family response regulator
MNSRILIVEDEPEMREALKHVLRVDYEVLAYSNGQEALAELGKTDKPVDLVITDIRMPGMSGYELILKMREKTPAPLIIAMSVYFDDDPELTVEIKKRAACLVRKPLDLMEMKLLVDELLRMREREYSNTADSKGSRATEADDGKEKKIERRSRNKKMQGNKKYLMEEPIWKVVTYGHGFSHGKKQAAHNHLVWV